MKRIKNWSLFEAKAEKPKVQSMRKELEKSKAIHDIVDLFPDNERWGKHKITRDGVLDFEFNMGSRVRVFELDNGRFEYCTYSKGALKTQEDFPTFEDCLRALWLRALRLNLNSLERTRVLDNVKNGDEYYGKRMSLSDIRAETEDESGIFMDAKKIAEKYTDYFKKMFGLDLYIGRRYSKRFEGLSKANEGKEGKQPYNVIGFYGKIKKESIMWDLFILTDAEEIERNQVRENEDLYGNRHDFILKIALTSKEKAESENKKMETDWKYIYANSESEAIQKIKSQIINVIISEWWKLGFGYGRRILTSKAYLDLCQSVVESIFEKGNPGDNYIEPLVEFMKKDPTKIYVLDKHPDIKKEVLRKSGIPDLSRLGRNIKLGLI